MSATPSCPLGEIKIVVYWHLVERLRCQVTSAKQIHIDPREGTIRIEKLRHLTKVQR